MTRQFRVTYRPKWGRADDSYRVCVLWRGRRVITFRARSFALCWKHVEKIQHYRSSQRVRGRRWIEHGLYPVIIISPDRRFREK